MFCCIGGHIPKEPVVNRRSGALYERALIDKHLAQNGPRCPLSGEPLTQEDLLPVHGGSANAAPGIARLMGADAAALNAGATSVPGLLNMLQSEWEALTLEQFSLRQQLATAQQELSLALYKHDAACRVIAKLVKERDGALAQLRTGAVVVTGGGGGSNVAGGGATSGGAGSALAAAAGGNDADAAQQLIDNVGGVPVRIVEELDANNERIKGQLKRFEVASGTASAQQVQSMIEVADVRPPHNGVGIQCISALDQHNSKLLFTGGLDGMAVCYDVDRKVAHATMHGHTKAITRIWSGGDTCITVSADGTGRIWRSDVGNFRTTGTLRHPGGINDFSIVPMMGVRYGLTAGVDGCLRLHDLAAGVGVADGGANGVAHVGLTTLAMHPYGLLGTTGAGPIVHLWDIRSMEVDANFTVDNDSGNVTSLHWNVDGRTLAIGTGFGTVQLRDLRKLTEPAAVLQWGENRATQMLRKPVSRVLFDESGQFLAVAADQVRVWGFKTGCPLANLATATEAPTDVAWGFGANWLTSCSASDRNAKIFAPH